MTQRKHCGETTRNGTPCKHQAGWGTDQDTGPCKYHSPENLRQRCKTVKKVAELLETHLTTIREACRREGINEATLWRWRQQHPDLDQTIENAKCHQSQIRVEKVEDALFKKIVNGKAAAAETIFWLKNRAPHRWRDRREQTVEVQEGLRDPRIQDEIDSFIEFYSPHEENGDQLEDPEDSEGDSPTE